MWGRLRWRRVHAQIEGAGGAYRVRYRDGNGEEHVEVFATRDLARGFVKALRRRPAARVGDSL
jgi:hypothetical protein